MKPTKNLTTCSENIEVLNCQYVELNAVLSDVEMELFRQCEWNHFTFGDCNKSMLSRNRMIAELQGSSADFKSAIDRLKTLPVYCFVAL
jgi:hypothetical protein